MSLVYVYCVTRTWSGGIEGVEGRPVRSVGEGDLAAVVSDVPEAAYEQSALDENVREGAWLTPRATAHQAVNAAVHGTVDAVLPVPFGTIYRTDERVREMLRDRADELRARLEQVRGRSEWVFALSRDTVQAAQHLSEVRDAMAHREPVVAGPGRQYLEDRKSDAARRAELARLDDEAAISMRHMLERVSKRGFEEPIADTSSDLVARATYLVRRSDEERLEDVVRTFNHDWRERGYELRTTGPWPPYRSSGVTS